jgi:hypothetical protein
MVTKEGFHAIPEIVKAIIEMSTPKSVKEVQSLNGRLVALNWFLARHAEKLLPFINTFKACINKNKFLWMAEAEDAFQEMKKYLSDLPTLTAPLSREKLKIYLEASPQALSTVLIVKRHKIQTPIYYISRVMSTSEVNYSILEKLVLALVNASRRLRRYFQAHPSWKSSPVIRYWI